MDISLIRISFSNSAVNFALFFFIKRNLFHNSAPLLIVGSQSVNLSAELFVIASYMHVAKSIATITFIIE